VDDPATGQVVVITDDPDEVLRSALSSGWSFVQGNRQVPDPEEAQ
jgi:hypothetical protein